MKKADTEMAVFYPLDFYRRTERRWKRRVKTYERPEAASPDRGNEWCPNCCLPVVRPFVSTYLPGRVDHYWVCKTCEFGWTSRIPSAGGLIEALMVSPR
jgi:hypothetical protein